MSQSSDALSRRTDLTPNSTDPRRELIGAPTVEALVYGRRRDRALLLALIAYASVLTVWVAGRSEAQWSISTRVVLLLLPLIAAAAGLAWRASRELALDMGTRRCWRWASVAVLLMPADLVRDALGGAAWPLALSAPLALAAPILLFAALLQVPSAPRTSLDRTRLALDVVTVAAAGALLSWYTLDQRDLPTQHLGRVILLHIQATLDVSVIVLISAIWRRTALLHRANVQVIIGGAVLVQFLGHVAALVLHRDGSVYVMQVVSPLVLAMLAGATWLACATVLHRELRPASTHLMLAASMIPVAAVLPGVVLLVLEVLLQSSIALRGLLAGAVGLTALAFIRQFASTREAVKLLAESAARENEARFRALVQHSSDVIVIVDIDATIRYVSPSMTTVFGHGADKLMGTPLPALLHPDDQQAALEFLDELAHVPMRETALSVGVLKREWRLRHANGNWMTVDNVGTNLLREPFIRGLVLNTRDVTEQSLIKQQYMHQAFHDPLTDLANRSLFLYQTGHALARSVRRVQPVTVLYLDLDNFKTVNDSLGHAAGDCLLVEAARRLATCVRDQDLIARLGGDEFAVLVEDMDAVDDVRRVAERIGAALARPFQLGNKEVFVNASIGVAQSQPGESSDDLIRNADVAMYVAKTRGKGRHVIFEPRMHAAALERLVVEADLRSAIDREEFFLQYQPIVNLSTGEIIGAEALVRWMCRERGTVPPGVFIPIAEETGLIVAIGRWVLRRACREAQRWTRERGHPLRITVNLSGRQLQDAAIVDDVRLALEDSGLDPTQLTIEITESMLMQHTDVSMARLTALKSLGVSLAIDDFGTGYSSLSYLQRYPIDILKIDKAFVDVMDKGGDGPVLASAIVALGETLRMTTVAEGIETEAQRGQLIGLGCELGQGYLFSRPIDSEDFWNLLVLRGATTPFVSSRIRTVSAHQAA